MDPQALMNAQGIVVYANVSKHARGRDRER
jgi:hypothetical protein